MLNTWQWSLALLAAGPPPEAILALPALLELRILFRLDKSRAIDVRPVRLRRLALPIALLVLLEPSPLKVRATARHVALEATLLQAPPRQDALLAVRTSDCVQICSDLSQLWIRSQPCLPAAVHHAGQINTQTLLRDLLAQT